MTNKSKYDPSDMFQAIFDFPSHIEDAVRIGSAITLKNKYTDIRNIVISGMGGSAIGGDVANMLIGCELQVPLKVVRGYELPNWVGANTLVVASSYSGNTEETLTAYADAKAKGAQICGITTGGKIGQLLETDSFDKVSIVGGLQPRAALAYSFVTLLFLLNKIGLIGTGFKQELRAVVELLKMKRASYSVSSSNPTLELARKIAPRLPIIYGETETTTVVARRWCGQLSENSKMLAHFNELPEFNHNEIVGWQNNPELLKQFAVIWLKDDSDHPRVQLRQGITVELIEKYCPQEVIAVEGHSRFVRLLHMIHYGDWVSYWCALEHATDPTPVEKIMKLKDRLARLQ